MKTLEFKAARGKLVKLFLMTIVMVAASFYCTTLDKIGAKVFGWIGVVFFSLAFYTIPKAWLNSNSPVIIFSDDGIDDRQGGFGLIEWSDIQNIQTHVVKGTKMLGIVLYDEEKFLQRVSSRRRLAVAGNRALGFPIVTLGFVGLDHSIDDAIRFVESRTNLCKGKQPLLP